MKKEVACVLSVLIGLVVSSALEFASEWHLWKTEHGKSYQSQREELDRHLVWLSNRELVETHNKNADHHGYSLALNHFGDLVYNTLFSPCDTVNLLHQPLNHCRLMRSLLSSI